MDNILIKNIYGINSKEFDKLTYQEKYHLYLETEEWKSISKYLRGAMKKCECCGHDNNLIIHHINYDRTDLTSVGNEYRSDIVILCRKCHEKAHNGNIIFILVKDEDEYNSLREILNKSKIICDGDTCLHYIQEYKIKLCEIAKKQNLSKKKNKEKNKRVYLVYLSYYRFKYNTFPIKRIFFSKADAEQYIKNYPKYPHTDLNIKEMVIY